MTSDAEPEAEVVADICRTVNTSVVAVTFASAGLSRQREFLVDLPRLPENPDPNIFFGRGNPSAGGSQPHAVARHSEILALTADDGPAHQLLYRQWAVSLFASWDEDLRPRLARARGVALAEVVVPAFGDLRLFRHDIIHNGAIASRKYSAKAEQLQWYREGDELLLDDVRVAEFVTSLPWDIVPYRL